MNKAKLTGIFLTVVCAGFLVQAQTQTQTLTDGQIIHIMKTANEEEADLGKMARSKADNKAVKDFAKSMADSHKQSEKDVKDVADKTKIKAVETDTSKNLEKDIEAKEKDLKKLKGAEFDKAYITQQISLHQQMLDDLNSKYIPAAQSPELKAYLETTKNHIQEHLTKAQQIQTTLTK